MVNDESLEFVALEENEVDRSAIMSNTDVSSNERVIEETYEMCWYMKYTKFYKAPITKFVSNVVSFHSQQIQNVEQHPCYMDVDMTFYKLCFDVAAGCNISLSL